MQIQQFFSRRLAGLRRLRGLMGLMAWAVAGAVHAQGARGFQVPSNNSDLGGEGQVALSGEIAAKGVPL